MDGTPYVFLDESGDFDFGPNGTASFVLTAVTMPRPSSLDRCLAEYRYSLLETGRDVEYFHCAKDKPIVRETVFEIIVQHLESMRIDCLVVDKAATKREMRRPEVFYPQAVGTLLGRVLSKRVKERSRMIVVTDRIPVKRKRKAVEIGIRDVLAKTAMTARDGYALHHHQSRSHFGLQVADYCCWAVQRKWSRGDSRYFALVEPALRGSGPNRVALLP